ncbi:polysaccharide biosynthesis protein [Peptococcaceae bacterium]|nr:polysaccharide biosynthesis protein [Peptococcaceae bacterium]
MNRIHRILLLMIIDIVLVNIGLYSALLIRFDGAIPLEFMNSFYSLAPIFTVSYLVCFYFFGLYKRLWEYASINELVAIVNAVAVGTVVNISLAYFLMEAGSFPFPRSCFAASLIINIILIGGSRLSWRLFINYKTNYRNTKAGKPILIVGAGNAGVLVARELRSHYKGKFNVVGFIDDDPNKKNFKILDLPVLGTRNDIPDIVNKYNISEIIIAMPSVKKKILRNIVEICKKTNAEVKILPGVFELIDGHAVVSQIREVQLEDLLGRSQVRVDLEKISGYLKDKAVLVTGAGGSIGSELCRQVMEFSPKALLLLDNYENNIYDIELELRNKSAEVFIYPLVKDIRDRNAIYAVFEKYKPDVVFHAAAHKHVPLMENNPEEAVKNNVLGTYNVASAADKYFCEKFILISTDKAVNPTSVMGATKRIAEMIIQYLNERSKTCYAAVRFGNVLGSKGSVIPLFKKQIASGGPVTVTHPDMVRYFMTIPEAIQLIIQAGAMAKDGEIFVLDMGEPIRIMDLAKSLIRLSGLEPDEDIEIVITGMRPGEKLYEEPLTAEEGVNATTHERIFIARPSNVDKSLIEKVIKEIIDFKLPEDKHETERFIKRFIPEFKTWQPKESNCNDAGKSSVNKNADVSLVIYSNKN